MKFQPYPLQFEPILKERIWGGKKLHTLLNKPISTHVTGESWEISAVEGDISLIANGTLKGKTLTELLNEFPEALLGAEVHNRFGVQFPLLFKFIDAREDLSIQVHPNDALAQKRHHSLGKTEMWYIMQADADARIIVGFKQQSNPQEFLSHLKDQTLTEILNEVPVQQGDVFFLETGTVHAIGAGIVLAEIQQTSDITYRVYDWNRKDAQGNGRELHLDLALDAIDYDVVPTKKNYGRAINQSNPVVDCPYFTTTFLPLSGTAEIRKNGTSFTVYMCVGGTFELLYNGVVYRYQKGDTVLLPAAMTFFTLNGTASILEIYIS